MNLRDWLIVIGVVIIVGILLDGYRRMRLAKNDSLQMARDMGGGEIDNTPIDDFNPELPGGGARIIDPSIDERALPEQPVESQIEAKSGAQLDSLVQPDSAVPNDHPSPQPIVAESDDRGDSQVMHTEPLVADAHSRIQVESSKVKTAHAGRKVKSKSIAKSNNEKDNVHKREGKGDELVIIINVHAKTQQAFPGADIKKLLEACGLDHGDMSIFHRHEEDDLLSPVQFSVANAIEPGYFDPDSLDTISTPGVSFFMSLPGPKDYSKAFDYMLETAECFARNLKGDLKDEHLSIMTSQTIEHNRHRIKEFERLQLSKSCV